jgi:hypothetical protein
MLTFLKILIFIAKNIINYNVVLGNILYIIKIRDLQNVNYVYIEGH